MGAEESASDDFVVFADDDVVSHRLLLETDGVTEIGGLECGDNVVEHFVFPAKESPSLTFVTAKNDW